jgi:hypothetical protein
LLRRPHGLLFFGAKIQDLLFERKSYSRGISKKEGGFAGDNAFLFRPPFFFLYNQ